ncbi:uncharacterized protein [Bemisia tabaci]|uniref:uncharacterized protein n=1 Tax=Bemisia tabaci TaxID=7038 RepID=UPI003B28CD3E
MVTHTCGLCSKVFRKKWNLIVHMKNVHDINMDEKLISCATCGYGTHDRLRFRRHMTRHHPDKPLDRSAFEMTSCNAYKLIECKLCNRVLRYQNMRLHRARVHKIEDSPGTEYEGIMCDDPVNPNPNRLRALLENKDLGYEDVAENEVSSGQSNLQGSINQGTLDPDQPTPQPAEQMEINHESEDSEEDTEENAKKAFKCSMCTQTFQKMKALKNHLHVEHNAADKQDHKKTCPICQYHPLGNTVFEMVKHFHTSHGIDVEVVKFRFKSVQEFFAWKLKEEAETCSKFSGRRKFSLRDCITFKCNRSGLRVSKSKGKRKCHTNFSSIKINGFCPANIRATRNPDDSVIVHYMKTHVGHEKDFKSVYLTEAERLKLANNLASKTPGNVVWHDVRGPVYFDDLVQPVTAAQEELKAARKEINVCLESKKYDQDAIAAWVKERWSTEEYPLIYFKEPGVPDELSQFHIEDFVLFFMSSYQKETFVKHGNDIICFDGTNNVNNHSIQMYTLLVSDETYTGFPCVFLFSNRNDSYVFKFFFQKIRDCMGVLAPNVFLTDFTAWYYDAWCSVMGVAPKKLLLCPWRVTESWRGKLAECVKSQEKRRAFFKTLENLLYTESEESFNSLLEEMYVTCNNDPELIEFANFFFDQYCKKFNVESWAYCYRINSQFNCHMQVDSYRHILKLCRLFGTKAAMLDKTLIAILRLMGSKLTNMLVKMSQTKILSKLHALMLHHRNCFRTDISAVSKDGEEWNVTLSENQHNVKPGTFHVKKIGECCKQCSLPCNVCKSCYHEYSCNCWEYNHHGQMCEHIHLVCRAVIAEQTVDKDSEPRMESQAESQSSETDNQADADTTMAMEIEEGEVDPVNMLELKMAENEAENFAKALESTPQQKLIQQFNKIVTSNVKTHADVLFVDKLLNCIEPSLTLLRKMTDITPERIDQQIAHVLKQTQSSKLLKQFRPSSHKGTEKLENSEPVIESVEPLIRRMDEPEMIDEQTPTCESKQKLIKSPKKVSKTINKKEPPTSTHEDVGHVFQPEIDIDDSVDLNPSPKVSNMVEFIKLNHSYAKKLPVPLMPSTKKLLIGQQKMPLKNITHSSKNYIPLKIDTRVFNRVNPISVLKANSSQTTKTAAGSAKKTALVNIGTSTPKRVFIQRAMQKVTAPKNGPIRAQNVKSSSTSQASKPLLLKILPKPDPGTLPETVPIQKPILLQILQNPDSAESKEQTPIQNPQPILFTILQQSETSSIGDSKNPAGIVTSVVPTPVKVISQNEPTVVSEQTPCALFSSVKTSTDADSLNVTAGKNLKSSIISEIVGSGLEKSEVLSEESKNSDPVTIVPNVSNTASSSNLTEDVSQRVPDSFHDSDTDSASDTERSLHHSEIDMDDLMS